MSKMPAHNPATSLIPDVFRRFTWLAELVAIGGLVAVIALVVGLIA